MAKRKDATLLIQATFRMYQQKQRWHKLRAGVIAFQRLLRRRIAAKVYVSEKELEERKFKTELEEIIERRKFMERRYKKIQKLPPNRIRVYLTWEKDVAAIRIQNWWRKQSNSSSQKRNENEDIRLKKEWAAHTIQSWVRRWLLAKQTTPALSKLLAHRVISEDRVRALYKEIEVWQQRNPEYVVDQEETNKLHLSSQERYRRFVAGTGARRLIEHRTGLLIAQAKATLELLEAAPALDDYEQQQWSQYHTLPLDEAAAARVQHGAALERLKWPKWRRRIDDIISD